MTELILIRDVLPGLNYVVLFEKLRILLMFPEGERPEQHFY